MEIMDAQTINSFKILSGQQRLQGLVGPPFFDIRRKLVRVLTIDSLSFISANIDSHYTVNEHQLNLYKDQMFCLVSMLSCQRFNHFDQHFFWSEFNSFAGKKSAF